MDFEKRYYEQVDLWDKNFHSIPAERERISKTIELIPPDVRTVLDVGCGNGAFLNVLPAKYQAVGLDSSEEALKHVRTKAVHGDIAALPFDPESFDLVTCLEVLEHLSYEIYSKALSELERVSKKYIIISVPNSEDLDYHLVTCPACRCRYNPYRHVRGFSPETLRTLFSQFELSELKEIGPLVPRPRYNKLLYTAYRSWMSTPPPATAVCPQCGYQVPSNSSAQHIERETLGYHVSCLNSIKLAVKMIWRPRWGHRWLLALYTRSRSKG
ncbi:TPA: class I SAM-dependent methyltransferase [Candidatus Bathyarchaeota archaeon]|nr:class I SAM-dependent methyltransferase [Candidatus Bathyarchaeota archaeon]